MADRTVRRHDPGVQLEFDRLETSPELCLGSRILDPQGGKEPVARWQELNNHVTHFHRATLLGHAGHVAHFR
jgi:hypothetical protein